MATEGASVASAAARKKGVAGASVDPVEDQDGDSDYDEASDDEDAPDGEEDVVLCDKAGEKAAARKKSENKMFARLFENLTEEQKAKVKASQERANEVEYEKDPQASQDRRAMTLRQARSAALAFSRRKFPCSLYKKCEKYDGRLYGIIVDGDGAKGTRVRRKREGSSKARDGVVSSVAVGNDSNSVYTIRWDDGSEDSTFTTSEVLLRALEDQDVVSLDEDKKLFKRWLCGALGGVYVHGYRSLIQDRNQKKNPRPGVQLDDDDKISEGAIRKYVWDTIKHLKASQTVNDHERALISSDKELMDKLDEEGSFLKMMGLRERPEGLLEETDKDFHMGQHKVFVEHLLRGAQESWKLGRYTSIESFITPVAAGGRDGDRGEFTRGHELGPDCNVRAEIRVDEEEVKRCGLATRVMLARASNGEEGDDQRLYIWLQHVPLYYLGQLTRPSHLGSIRGNSEHSRYVAQTKKPPTFFEFASRGSSTGKDNSNIQKRIYEAYDVVSSQKRGVKSDIENCDPQHGYGRKHNRGRTDATLLPKERIKQVRLLIDIVRKNGVEQFASRINAGNINNCWDILKANKRYLNKTNEEHLKAPWIKAVVNGLIESGVTLQMVSTFSLAFAVNDRLTSSVNRSQDVLRCKARNAHVFEGEARDVINRDNKNYARQARTKKGVKIHHTKSPYVVGMYAALIVICSPLMKELLRLRAEQLQRELDELEDKPMSSRETLGGRKARMEKLHRRVEKARGEKLSATTGPFDENGKSLGTKSYSDLLRFVGRSCFGIPNWGSHIARTEHITLVHTAAVERGMSVDHPDVVQLGWEAGHGEATREKFYENIWQKNGSDFVCGHGGLFQSLTRATSRAAPGATPLSPGLPPMSGDHLHCFFD